MISIFHACIAQQYQLPIAINMSRLAMFLIFKKCNLPDWNCSAKTANQSCCANNVQDGEYRPIMLKFSPICMHYAVEQSSKLHISTI